MKKKLLYTSAIYLCIKALVIYARTSSMEFHITLKGSRQYADANKTEETERMEERQPKLFLYIAKIFYRTV